MPQRLERALRMAEQKRVVAEPMAMAQPRGDGSYVLPRGFEPCPRDDHRARCPSCCSALILKVPTNERREKKKSGDDALEESLENANAANMLLQALSFDAATREERRELDPARLAEGVSYCPECKVHVVTSADELTRLFDHDDDGDEEVNDMEWLRGSLLVTVDDAEVTALSKGPRNRRPQQQWLQPIGNPSFLSAPSLMSALSEPFCSPPQQEQEQQQQQQQQSLLTRQSSNLLSHVLSTEHDTQDAEPHNQRPKPARPSEFDYDYRHSMATHAMANRIGRGYCLIEEICPECEMPLMKNKKRKECVVCPKLLKKIAKYHPEIDQNDTMDDPISAIIKEARLEAAPKHDKSNRRNRHVQPKIAEAKQYVMQTRIMGGKTAAKSNHPGSIGRDPGQSAGREGCNVSEVASQDTESLTDQTNSTTEDHKLELEATAAGRGMMTTADNSIDWEELLTNGRAILSKRLNEGWVLSSNNCMGAKCKGTPLLQRLDEGGGATDLEYCVVCGGLGTGTDGAYERELELQALAEREANPDWEDLASNGRALLAERLKQGWTMTSENCRGCHCNEMPLTNFEGGPDNCVVCSGSGSGEDGRYENYRTEVEVEEERAMVSKEISSLLSMGWVLRETLCNRCLMPLVAEDHHTLDELCILCGQLPENNPHMDVGVEGFEVVEDEGDLHVNDGVGNGDPYVSNGVGNDDPYVNNGIAEDDSYGNDSSMNEYCVEGGKNQEVDMNEIIEALKQDTGFDRNIQIEEGLIADINQVLSMTDDTNGQALTPDGNIDEKYAEEEEVNVEDEEEGQAPIFNRTLEEAVNAPVPWYGDDNTDQAGKKLVMGWTLPDIGCCYHCGGVMMSPPNSPEIGCINQGCPAALAAAYTFLPEPYESTGPVILIGRGFTKPSHDEEEVEEVEYIEEGGKEQAQMWDYNERNSDYYEYDNARGVVPMEHYEEYMNPPRDDGPPLEVYSEHCHDNMQGVNDHYYNNSYDEPSVLSNDLTEARSVASSALGVILVRLDGAKRELEEMVEDGRDPKERAEKQVEIAMLIEKLANVAVALKRHE